jgi:hypothetical protein
MLAEPPPPVAPEPVLPSSPQPVIASIEPNTIAKNIRRFFITRPPSSP